MDKLNTINDILEKLAISQAKTDVQLAKTDAQLAETDKTLQELAVSQAETDAQLKASDARLTKKLDKIGKLVGGIGNSQGDVAEEFFYNSIKAKPVLNQIKYDFVDKNVTRSRQDIEDEYDIVLVNGKDVAIIEVKYKAHQGDLDRFLHKKYVNFKKLYPEYNGFQHHLALASFTLNDEVKEAALAKGVMVLQRKGDVFETTVPGEAVRH